ncbi:MAG: hypothetical protein BGO12_19205 [Verrucomicrobia bacterium 61-8]|nr:LacI family DNA-binding transcriptional regulator [Verrucomicrobiota bacterium]OJV00884.1 MAG: hypothetical protein BGO12_19205 [Verrucomicrobia bacterium 61-8]
MKSSKKKGTPDPPPPPEPRIVPGRVSIRDLAAIACVSRTTVSLALRDSHRVSAPVRKEIQKLAAEHNYRSNPMVTALMQQVRSKRAIKDSATIAFVTSSHTREEWKKYSFNRQIWEGALAEATRLGFRLEEFWAGPGARDISALAGMLYHRGIRALCFAPMAWPHPSFELPWDRFVAIACTASTGIAELPVVRSDHTHGMHSLLSRLRGLEAQSIGVAISLEDDERIAHAWSAGAHTFCLTAPETAVHLLRLKDYGDFESFAGWFQKTRPQVVVGLQSTIPAFLERLGMGGKIAYASLDVLTEELDEIAGVFQDPFYLGQRGVEYVSKAIYDQVFGLPAHPESIVVRGRFVEGRSLAPLRKAPARSKTKTAARR